MPQRLAQSLTETIVLSASRGRLTDHLTRRRSCPNEDLKAAKRPTSHEIAISTERTSLAPLSHRRDLHAHLPTRRPVRETFACPPSFVTFAEILRRGGELNYRETTCGSVFMRHGTLYLTMLARKRLDGNATDTADSSNCLREAFQAMNSVESSDVLSP